MMHHKLLTNMTTLKLLIFSCIAHFLLHILFDKLIPDASKIKRLHIEDETKNAVDSFLRRLFYKYTRWDSEFYLLIAAKGYQLDKHAAFMPFYPTTVRVFCEILQLCTLGYLSTFTCLIVSGFLVSNVSFILAGLILFKLTLQIFDHNTNMANITVLLYTINPISIFFHTIYTESIYHCFFLAGLLAYQRSLNSASSMAKVCFFFSLSSVMRSPGLFNFGYPIHYVISNMIHKKDRNIKNCIKNILYVILGFLPFILFQYYLYCQFCYSDDEQATIKRKRFCDKSGIVIPYFRANNKYWNVGFLQYYSWYHSPTLILVSPTIYLAILACRHFWRQKTDGDVSIWLYLFGRSSKNNILAPHIVHTMFVLIFSLLIINIEVTTRVMFACCPLLIWYCAQKFDMYGVRYDTNNVIWCLKDMFHKDKRIICFFLGFVIIGSLLHVNYYWWI